MKNLLYIICALLLSSTTYGQLSGVITIPNSSYPNLSTIIDSLNIYGVGLGGVTINLTAGNPQTAPSTGYQLGSAVLNSSVTSAKPITINGHGNTITAGVGTTDNDGIFILKGIDYVTIDSLNLSESSANITATAAMEYGFALRNRNATAPLDGCQYNTISNCIVTLNKAVALTSCGIHSAHQTTTATTSLVLTDTADTHSYNKIYSNTVSNCANPIYIAGYNASAPYTLYDKGNVVGGATAVQRNLLKNFGVRTTSVYAYGIYLNNQAEAVVSNNYINNAEGNIAATPYSMHGIYVNGVGSNFTITKNNIYLTDTLSANVSNGIFAAAAGRLVAKNNQIRQLYSGTGTVCGISTVVTDSLLVDSNKIYGATLLSSASLSYYAISATGNARSESITNNLLDSISGTTAHTYIIYAQNNAQNVLIDNNKASNLSATNMVLIQNINGVYASGRANITNNVFNNISAVNGGNVNYGVFWGNNKVQNITSNTITGDSLVASDYPIYIYRYGDSLTLAKNLVSKFITNRGIRVEHDNYSYVSIDSNIIRNLLKNNGVSSLGTAFVDGLEIASTNTTSTAVVNVSGNILSELAMAGSSLGMALSGIVVTTTSGTVNVFNNRIANFVIRSATAGSTTCTFTGISLGNSSSLYANLYYNTIYFSGSAPGNILGTFPISSSTGSHLKMNDNIIVSLVSPGIARSIAFYRSNTNMTTYDPASGHNIFYAGSPSTNRVIYYDNTNSLTTLASYQAFAGGGRDSISYTENVPFVSTSADSPDFLSVSTTSVAINHGINITGITTDAVAHIRQGNPGYTGGNGAD